VIHTATIELGALLKWAGIVDTGGHAKALVADGRVAVNGVVERRRGRDVRAGDLVTVRGAGGTRDKDVRLRVVGEKRAAAAATLPSRIS